MTSVGTTQIISLLGAKKFCRLYIFTRCTGCTEPVWGGSTGCTGWMSLYRHVHAYTVLTFQAFYRTGTTCLGSTSDVTKPPSYISSTSSVNSFYLPIGCYTGTNFSEIIRIPVHVLYFHAPLLIVLRVGDMNEETPATENKREMLMRIACARTFSPHSFLVLGHKLQPTPADWPHGPCLAPAPCILESNS